MQRTRTEGVDKDMQPTYLPTSESPDSCGVPALLCMVCVHASRSQALKVQCLNTHSLWQQVTLNPEPESDQPAPQSLQDGAAESDQPLPQGTVAEQTTVAERASLTKSAAQDASVPSGQGTSVPQTVAGVQVVPSKSCLIKKEPEVGGCELGTHRSWYSMRHA